MRAFANDAEIKYKDDAANLELNVPSLITVAGTQTGNTNYTLDHANVGNNICTLDQGTSAVERIGNKVLVKSIRAKMTLEATQRAATASASPNEDSAQYIRTIFRVAIVRDLQVNNPLNKVAYAEVFDGNAATHDCTLFEKSIANMGRFQILYDKRHICTGGAPVKTIDLNIPVNRMLRFNGPGSGALQDYGYYFLVAAVSYGVRTAIQTVQFEYPNVAWQSRVTFQDA